MQHFHHHAPRRAIVLACAVYLLSLPMHAAASTPDHDKVGPRPQDDFYIAVAQADRDVIGHPPPARFAEADDETPGVAPHLSESDAAQLHTILDSAASKQHPPGTRLQRLGDFFISFTDADTIENLGTHPLEPLFARIDAIHGAAELGALFGYLGIVNIPAPLTAVVERSPTNSARLQVRLASTDMDYSHLQKAGWTYPPSVRLANPTRYVAYIEFMLSGVGDAQAPIHAKQILSFETQLDQIARTRHPSDAGPQSLTLTELGHLAPGIAWPAFVQARGFGDKVDSMVIENPNYVHALDALIAKTSIDTIKTYLKFKCLDVYADYLPRRFSAARRKSGPIAAADPDHPQRWQAAVDLINVTLGNELGREYTDRYFSPARRASVSALVESIRDAYRREIADAAWLDDESRRRATAKLDGMSIAFESPSGWQDNTGPVIRRSELFGNMMRIAEYRNREAAARIGQRIDYPIDLVLLPQYEVFRYIREDNCAFLSAAAINDILSANINVAEAYGNLGTMIAHEMTHAFGPRSTLLFDQDANRPTWLTEPARLRYIQKMEALATQFNTQPPTPYPPMPGLYTIQSYALDESVADLAGLQVSFSAYQARMRHQPAQAPLRLSGEKRFFYAFADSRYDESHLEHPLRTHWTAHAPAFFETNAIVRNLDGFYRTFDIKPMDELYLPENRRITLW